MELSMSKTDTVTPLGDGHFDAGERLLPRRFAVSPSRGLGRKQFVGKSQRLVVGLSDPDTAATRSFARASYSPSPARARCSTLAGVAITTEASSTPGVAVSFADTVISETRVLV
jgi:hypothetical protein